MAGPVARTGPATLSEAPGASSAQSRRAGSTGPGSSNRPAGTTRKPRDFPAARARYGLSLMLAYRHAHVTAAAEQARPVVVPLPVRREAAPTGLLGRLRSRLRALAA